MFRQNPEYWTGFFISLNALPVKITTIIALWTIIPGSTEKVQFYSHPHNCPDEKIGILWIYIRYF